MAWAISCFGSCVSQAAERVALVIGNSQYGGGLELRNPVNDADAVAAALKELDFTVIEKKDLDKSQMEDALIAFRRALPKGGLGLFYYAGHGVQVKGENYLVPLGARIREEFEVKRECLEVSQVLDAMDESESNLKVLILDCCRDNPFTRGWKRGAGQHGLAAISDVPEGTVIAFSTAPGKTAEDGGGKNSPYAEQLVAAMRSRPAEGLELGEVFRDASRAVKHATGQVGWLNMEASLEKYYLRPAGAAAGKLTNATAPPSTNKVTRNSIGMELVLIPAGQFKMGSPVTEKDRSSNENQVDVTLTKAFYIGKTEVTQRQWRDVMGTTPWKDRESVREGSNYPATYLSFLDAQEFCKKLTQTEQATYRLPTEAEWEYACRGGTATQYSFGDDDSRLTDYAWFSGNAWRVGEKYPHEVAGKLANRFGLYDMHGNVGEWCAGDFLEALSGGTDPTGELGTLHPVFARAIRGGDWCRGEILCRSASRIGDLSGDPYTGFRVVLAR
jgi:formylglycine-generating enzyme required for sulfatase activity